MDQGRTHIIKYPYVGANCKAQLEGDEETKAAEAAAQGEPVEAPSSDKTNQSAKDKDSEVGHLRNCPERPHGGMTMDQGRTHIIKYPNVGANCKAQMMAQAPATEKTAVPSKEKSEEKEDAGFNAN